MNRSRCFSAMSRALVTLSALVAFGLPVSAADESPSYAVEVSPPVTPWVFDGDLRDLPPVPDWKPGDPIKYVPRRFYPRPGTVTPPPDRVERDPLVDLQRSTPQRGMRAFTNPSLSFAGFGFNGVAPPDTVGDVGPNHYIQAINSGGGTSFRVYNKSGNPATAPITLDSLGSGLCGSGWGDPIVLYDPLADRWLLSEFASGNSLCVYISKTPNPVSGGWYNYRFGVPNFPDYPKYSVWSDAYYVTSNEGGNPPIYALDRSKMLTGAAATFQRFTASPPLSGFGFQALTPVDFDGSTAPPGGSPAYIMRHRDDEVHGGNTSSDYLDMWQLAIDWNTPANSQLTKLPAISVSEFDSTLCGTSSFQCFPQPGTSTTLDPLREVIMHRLIYRNFGSHEAIVGNFVTDVGDNPNHGGVRWFELRRTGGAWSLFQEGTFSPNASHRWMAGIAMDQDGNIALGYSVSDGNSTYPSIRYTGRQSTDPAGTMTQGETEVATGAGSQGGGNTRWGDYSAMGIDPADDCTFWYTNMYTPTSAWRTWIAAFKFDSCGGAPPGSGVDYVVGEGLGATNTNAVRVYTNAGAATSVNFQAYGAGGWGTNVASGDINGGATWEILTGPGPGAVYGPQIRAFDSTGAGMGKVNYYAYGTLRYGANVAAADIDTDAFHEIITGAGAGSVFGPHVRGWNFDNSAIGSIAKINYFAYSTLKFGVKPARGNVDGDGFDEILTGAGPGSIFGPQVRGWNVDGGNVSSIGAINFFAHTTNGYGVNVAGGDVEGDSFDETLTTPGPGPSHPAQFRGFDYDNSSITGAPGFTTTPFSTTYGGRVGAGDLAADGSWELLAGAGRSPSANSDVLAFSYNGSALSQVGGTPFRPFSGGYGVNVTAGTLGY